MPSVIDFGADPTGGSESTNAFLAAIAAHPGNEIHIPAGTYEVGASSLKLDFAGTRWIGASKYTTIIKAKSGTTGSLCLGTGYATGTSAYCAIESLQFDLNGEACTAIDLSSTNNSVVRDCFFNGGWGDSGTLTSGSLVVTGLSSTARVKSGQIA